jgi:hypothetical protein
METERFNCFNAVHKALRLMLLETSAAIQHNDFADMQATMSLTENIQLVVEIYEEHARHEDTFMFPMIAIHEPALAARFDSEHEEDMRLGRALLDKVASCKNAVTEIARREAGRQLLYAFNDFAAFNLAHMNREEREVNPVLWQHYTDTEVREMTAKMRSAIAPERMDLYLVWMFKAINRHEATQALLGTSQSASPEVFNAMLAIAEKNMDAERWKLVRDGLSVNQ